MDIRGLFNTPTLNAEEIFKPVYLGLERKRQKQQDQERRDDRQFSRQMAIKQDERSEESLQLSKDSNVRAEKSAEQQQKVYDMNMLEKTGSLEEIRKFSTPMYERIMEEKNAEKLKIQTAEARYKNLMLYNDKMSSDIKRMDEKVGMVEKQQKLMTDKRNIESSTKALLDNLERDGFLAPDKKLLVLPPQDKDGRYVFTESYMDSFKSKLVAHLDKAKVLPTEYVNDIYNLDDAVKILSAQVQRLSGSEAKNIDIKPKFSSSDTAITKEDSAFDKVKSVVRSFTIKQTGNVALHAGERVFNRQYKGLIPNFKSAVVEYIENGTIPERMAGDDRKSFAARQLFQRVASGYAKDISLSMMDDKFGEIIGGIKNLIKDAHKRKKRLPEDYIDSQQIRSDLWD